MQIQKMPSMKYGFQFQRRRINSSNCNYQSVQNFVKLSEDKIEKVMVDNLINFSHKGEEQMAKILKNMNPNKLKKGLNHFAVCVICLLLLTACGKNNKPEQSSNKSEAPVTQVETIDGTDNSEDSLDFQPSDADTEEKSLDPIINTEGETISERFIVPTGFTRVKSEEESFAYYLQNLPLKPHGSKVKYFDGREKLLDVYLAVVDFSLGDRDLQQCADGVMRLRAEYLYEKERYDEIHFNFVSGFYAEFAKWAAGNGISIDGNNVSWVTSSSNNGSYESFQKYLDIVYAYASTLSLEKELIEKPFEDMGIGDVFIQGGSPGHCVIVVDMAMNEATGEKLFMLAQSYMPAQDIQILRVEGEESPWFSGNIEDTLYTPEWTFQVTDLKTWE